MKGMKFNNIAKVLTITSIVVAVLVLINIVRLNNQEVRQNQINSEFENSFNNLISDYNTVINLLNENSDLVEIREANLKVTSNLGFLESQQTDDLVNSLRIVDDELNSNSSIEEIKTNVSSENKKINLYIEELQQLINESRFIR